MSSLSVWFGLVELINIDVFQVVPTYSRKRTQAQQQP